MSHEIVQLNPEMEQAKGVWSKEYDAFCARQGVDVKTVFSKKCYLSIQRKADEYTRRLTLPLAFESLATTIFGEGSFIEEVDATKSHDYDDVFFKVNIDSTKSTVLRESIDPDRGPRVVNVLPNGQEVAVENFIHFNMRDMTIHLSFSTPDNRVSHPGGGISESSVYAPNPIPLDLANTFPELLIYLEGLDAPATIHRLRENEDLRKAERFVEDQKLKRWLEKLRRHREARPKLSEVK